jgi:RND superfamily putative drug exporter
MAKLARWCFNHRVLVVLLWLGGVVGIGAVNAAVGTGYNDNFSLPGTESSRALELLESALPAQAGESDTIVWRVDQGTVSDPAVRDRVTAMLGRVADAPGVTGVTSPYTEQGANQISADGRTAYATVQLSGFGQEVPVEDVRNIVDIAQSARTDGLQVEVGGNAIQQANGFSTNVAELVGLLAAALILLIAFGSLLAMLLPLVTAIVSLVAATFMIGLLSNGVTIATIAPTFATLIGLGVGIDYALFVVTRYRNGLKAGLAPEEAAVRALNTSGRAVIFAGLTVCVAMLGLFVLNVNFLNGIAVSAAFMVLFNVLAAITLLPAMLGFMKTRVLSRRERRRLAVEGPQEVTGFWVRWASFVGRHPRPLAAAALLVIMALSVPVLTLRPGSSDQSNDPASSTTRKAYDMLSAGFGPGFNGPLQLIAETPAAGDQQALAALTATVARTPGVAAAFALPAQPGARIGIVRVIPTTSPQDEETSALIERLRTEVIPPAERGTTMQVYVGGQTAIFDDFADVLIGKLPLFITVIVGLGFVLLLIAFRSILVPLTAAVMNLLAAAASFGVVVAVFQWGWGSEALGVGRAGPVEAFLPPVMLAILFGLSMDYQVFLVSRMHEEWVHTRDNRRAIIVGQASTGRVITAAGMIMVCVFMAFVFGGQRIIAEFGLGLASAVFIDAFILRTVLVPVVMHLFGSGNWWLPRWIDRWLPHLAVEPAEDSESAPEPPRNPVTASA